MNIELLSNSSFSEPSNAEPIEELLGLGFLPMEDSPYLGFFKHLPNSICVEAFITQETLLIKIHVINEFEGPYDKSEDICLVLNTSDIHAALHFADCIKQVTIDNQII